MTTAIASAMLDDCTQVSRHLFLGGTSDVRTYTYYCCPASLMAFMANF